MMLMGRESISSIWEIKAKVTSAQENQSTSGKGPGKSGKAGLAGLLGLLGILALKAKSILAFGMGGLKFGALFSSFGVMFLNFGLYAIACGWNMAFALVFVMLIHELGHYVCMKRNGLNPGLPVFVPFLGAFVEMSKLPDNENVRAWVSLAGPLTGGYTSIAIFHWGLEAGSDFWIATGWFGCILNMLQLFGMKPLDGGHVVGILDKWFMAFGTLILILAGNAWNCPVLFVISMTLAYWLYQAFFGKTAPTPSMLPATPSQKTWIGIAYFGTALALGYVYHLSDGHMPKF